MPKATLYNPTTGERKAVESGSKEAQGFFSSGFHLETSYDPITKKSTYDIPAPKPTTPIGVNNNNSANISQGSDGPRDSATKIKEDYDALIKEMNDKISSGFDANAEFEKLKQERLKSKIISDSELAQIESAGTVAGEEFDPLIQASQEAMRQGRASNLVATGRRGGLQRARFVGAEVYPSEFGPGKGTAEFEGAGGRLELAASV